MAAHLRACAKLDRSIRQESETRTIFDPLMRQQRAELRAECEAALLADYRLSQVDYLLPANVSGSGACIYCPGSASIDQWQEISQQIVMPMQKHDVERLLWKGVFYRPIEEFRWDEK
jgi:hypothetical protein